MRCHAGRVAEELSGANRIRWS